MVIRFDKIIQFTFVQNYFLGFFMKYLKNNGITNHVSVVFVMIQRLYNRSLGGVVAASNYNKTIWAGRNRLIL